MTIAIAGVVFLLTFSTLLLRQALIMRKRNHRMMEIIRRLMHYRNIVIQNGDSVEMGETHVSDELQEEYKQFKEVDKRIMKERLFANPDFGRDDLMRLLGVDKNALSGIIQRQTGT